MVTEEVDFALPDFRAVAADLKQQGADLVFDSIDSHGNARLCQAMDEAGARVTAKVTNVRNWTSTVAEDYKDAPHCRNALWATGSSRNFDDTGHKAVREFRAATEGLKTHSQWQSEGWAAARWFTDAARSCARTGARTGVTRACVDDFVNRAHGYTAGGLLLPVTFARSPEPPGAGRTCLSVARWRDGEGWISQGDMNRTCFDVPHLAYKP
ncbi:hypothetical protein ACVW19_001284 [Streptomyces sp. TE5632]